LGNEGRLHVQRALPLCEQPVRALHPCARRSMVALTYNNNIKGFWPSPFKNMARP